MIPGVRAPEFWWSGDPLPAQLLWPAAALYGAVAGWKMRRRADYVAKIPVICVGNFVAGGAGKTPVALALADILLRAGKRPGFLSRGYGGRARGPLVVDPHLHSAGEVGDEPLLLAARAITMVARDRVAGAKALERTEIDCIVLDDGFQNPALKKSRSWVVVDGAVGVGNGRCLPAGPLRAPLDVQLACADRVVMMGDGRAREALAAVCRAAGVEIVMARLAPSIDPALRDRKLVAYCGIGRPDKFFDTLRGEDLEVAKQVAFADHHVLTESQARVLLDLARSADSVLVTTAKDFVRLKSATGGARQRLAELSKVVPVACRFEDEAGVESALLEPFIVSRKR